MYILKKINENIQNGYQVTQSTKMLVDGSDGQMEGQTALCHNEIFFFLQNVRIKLNN